MTAHEGRRCALPGCYVVIQPEPDGRPQRKYCTAAHRAVARQMRREGAQRSASAPPLPTTPAQPLPPLATLPGPDRRRKVLAELGARRFRAAAVLGSAGLLVTGGGLMTASSPPGSSGVSSVISPWLAGTPEAEQQWARQAQVSLASLDAQLAEIDATEEAMASSPEARIDPNLREVRDLQARRGLLRQRRDSLVTELANWQSIQDARSRLSDTDQQVDRLERAIESAPKRRQLTSDERRIAAQLQDQRSMRLRQRVTQQRELDGLRKGLHDAMASPLPADEPATRSITSRVRDLIDNKGQRNREPLPGRPAMPDVLANKEPTSPDRKDVGNGAPPVPGRTKPELPSKPDVLAAPKPPNPGAGQPNNGGVGPGQPGTRREGGVLANPRLPGPTVNRRETTTPRGADEPVTRDVDRVSDDSFIGPPSRPRDTQPQSTRPGGRSVPQRPQPRTTYVGPDGDGNAPSRAGGYTDRERMRDAADIARALESGDMNKVADAAARAKQREEAARRSGRSGEGRDSSRNIDDYIDSMHREYGIDDGQPRRSGRDDSGSRRSKYSSRDLDRAIESGRRERSDSYKSRRSGRDDSGSRRSKYSSRDLDREIDRAIESARRDHGESRRSSSRRSRDGDDGDRRSHSRSRDRDRDHDSGSRSRGDREHSSSRGARGDDD